ncbi:MAG: FAD-dependent monooxygenase [Pyrinomonadaceae bacterium]
MQTDVLIVGAGPTGLALACQLIRYGVDFIIIDKKETTTPHSKAIGVHARTLEVYEQMGLADKLIGLGAIAEKARMFAGGRVRGEVVFKDIGKGLSPYPYVLIVEQGKHERLIYDFIRSHGKDVRWQTELQTFVQDTSGVSAQLKNGRGATETIQARYMVACDGAKSPVRHALGLKFEGSTFERIFYVADVDIDWQYGHDALQIFLMRNALLAFFPMTGERQYRIVGTFPEEFAKDEGDILYDEIEERIKLDADLDLDITKVNWFSTYKVHTRHVDSFSQSRCFLAGDAAHIHTPAGAQGMNTGIQDGYNLAWKLAAVLKNDAPESLLETYNEERLPVADQLMETTDRFFNLAASPDRLLVFARLYIFPYIANLAFSLDAIKRFVFPRISQIAINYRYSSLSRTDGSFLVRAGDRMPWFTVNGSSIYDAFIGPAFHLVLFLDENTDVPPLPDDLMKSWAENIGSHVFSLTPQITDIFGCRESFFLILRPDNYIGLISKNFSAETVRNYLSTFTSSDDNSLVLLRRPERDKDRIANLSLALPIGRLIDDLTIKEHRG